MGGEGGGACLGSAYGPAHSHFLAAVPFPLVYLERKRQEQRWVLRF